MSLFTKWLLKRLCTLKEGCTQEGCAGALILCNDTYTALLKIRLFTSGLCTEMDSLTARSLPIS